MSAQDVAVPARPAYRDANVLRWLTAYTASVAGDVVFFLALSWAATRAGGPSQVGLVVAAGAVPRAVLMLGGGVVADRCGPRRVAVLSDGVRCVVILLAAAALALAPAHLWLLALVALVFGVVDAVFMPHGGSAATAHHDSRPARPRPGDARTVDPAEQRRGTARGGGRAGGRGSGGRVRRGGGALRRLPRHPAHRARHPGGRTVAARLRARRAEGRAALRPPPPAAGAAGRGDRAERDVLQRARRHRTGAPGRRARLGCGGHGVGGERVQRGCHGLRAAAHRGTAGTQGGGGDGGGPARHGRGGRGPGPGALADRGRRLRRSDRPDQRIRHHLDGALVQTATDPRYLGRVTSVTTLCTLGLAPVLFPAVGITVELWGAATFFMRLRRDLPARRCARPRRSGAAAGGASELGSA